MKHVVMPPHLTKFKQAQILKANTGENWGICYLCKEVKVRNHQYCGVQYCPECWIAFKEKRYAV